MSLPRSLGVPGTHTTKALAGAPLRSDADPYAGWEEVGVGSGTGGGISDNSGRSVFLSLAIAPDGTPYVAWNDDSSGGYQIYVRRWDGSTWAEVGASSASGGGISDNSGGSFYPSLAITPDGTPYVAWNDGSSGNSQIYVRRWDGSNWAEVGASSASGGGISDNSGISGASSLAIAPDGTPYVAWSDDSSGDNEIYVRRWDGSTWVEVETGSASGGGISDNSGISSWPSLAIAPDGTPYVAWEDDSSGNREIYVRRWDGSTWAEVGVDSASSGGISENSDHSVSPSAAIAPDGSPYVAWYDHSSGYWEIYVRRWDGSTWAEVGASSASGGGISDNSGDSGFPSLAIAPDGTPYVAWEDRGSGNEEIYVRRWDESSWAEVGAGSASGGGISDNSGDSRFPSAAIAPDGTPYVAWKDDSSGDEEIYVRRRPEGDTFSVSGQVKNESGDPIPGVAISARLGGSATTDVSGAYTLTNLISATYTLTPSLTGWTFTPLTRTVTVPPDAMGQDFTGAELPIVTDLGSQPGDNAGQVKLTWKAPSSGSTPIDHYVIKYSDQPIDESSWASADLMPGIPPAPGGPDDPQQMVISGMPLRTRLYYAIKTADAVDNESALSNVPSLQDIGLRPDPSGFWFPNYGGNYPDPPSDGDLTFEDLRLILGDDLVCIWVLGYCFHHPSAEDYLETLNHSLNEGHCFGMSATSLRFFAGTDEHPGFDTPHDLDLDYGLVATWNGDTRSTTTRRQIAFMQAMQAPPSMLSYLREYRNAHTPVTLFSDLSQRWAANLDGWPILAMYGPLNNYHAVTPFALQYDGSDVLGLWVYDNRAPDTLRHIERDPDTGAWSYGIEYVFSPDGHDLALVPLSVLDVPQSLSRSYDVSDTLAEASSGQVWLLGGGHLLITDEQDRQIGFIGGTFVDEIPGAFADPIAYSPGTGSEPVYSVPLTQSYTILLDGQTLTDAAMVQLAQFGPAYAAKVKDVVLDPGEQDHLTIASDGSQIAYQVGDSKEVDLILARDHAAESYRFAFSGADVGSGEVISILDDEASGWVRYSHAGAGAGVYDLAVTRVSAEGRERFEHGSVEISAMDTHNVLYGTWDGSGAITIEIDHFSDGTIDDVIELPNEAATSHIYLPLILRNH